MNIELWRKKFGENLERRMVEKGLSQTDLGNKSDIATKSINDYINGKGVPNAWRLVNLAKALDCTTDDLVDFGETVINW